MKIIELQKKHWGQVSTIYQMGMDTKNATFQSQCPTWEEWDSSHRYDCRLVAEENKNVIGWAALSPVSSRFVYSGVAEVSIYIHPDYAGKGIGNKLLQNLITKSEFAQIWTLQAGIFPENKASIHLHLKNGFRIVGTREKLGLMDNTWRDVTLLERRSNII